MTGNAQPSDTGERTLEMAVRRMGLSARAHDRILKVARTAECRCTPGQIREFLTDSDGSVR